MVLGVNLFTHTMTNGSPLLHPHGDTRWMLSLCYCALHNRFIQHNTKTILDPGIKWYLLPVWKTHTPARYQCTHLYISKEDCPKTKDKRREGENEEDTIQKFSWHLLYIATHSRPEISYAVRSLSKVLENPSSTHWKMAKEVVRYLLFSPNLQSTYRNDGNRNLVGFVDSDWVEMKTQGRVPLDSFFWQMPPSSGSHLGRA